MEQLTQDFNLIHEDSFNGMGSIDMSGWSSPRAEGVLGPQMLSRRDGERNDKSFDIPENTGSVAIEFRMFEIGEWDGEEFIVHINGQDVSIGTFLADEREGATSFDAGNGITVEKSIEIGRNDGHSNFHNVRIIVEEPGMQLDLGFSSTLDEAAEAVNWRYDEESWAVDKLKISASPAEEPNTDSAIPFQLFDDGNSPVESATYDADTGLLELTFSWDKLLEDSGYWGNGRHIDFVEFDGVMHGINIHSDDAPRDAQGNFIYNEETMNNTFTLDIGTGHNPADGIMAFELHDYEDGSVKLYDFQMSNMIGAEHEGLVAAVNSGSATAFTSIQGITYDADTSGINVYTEARDIAGTLNDVLYHTEAGQNDDFVLETELANGFYDVELKFAEIWGGASEAGVRSFSFLVEDEVVIQDLDLSGTVGFATAVDYVGTVEVTDGVLNFEGLFGSKNAKLSGYSIWESDKTEATDFEVGEILQYRATTDAGTPADINGDPNQDWGDNPNGDEWKDEGTETPSEKPDETTADGEVNFIDDTESEETTQTTVPYEFYDDGSSPVESATYNADTGLLELTFDWAKLLQSEGEWGNARHIDFVEFNGTMYGVNIHSEDAPRNADGSYIYTEETMNNTFTIDIGAGIETTDGVLSFELHDYADGSVKLYDFQMSNSLNAANDGLVAAVNAGGNEFTSIQGVTYEADTSGISKYSEGHDIAGTTSDALYQTEAGQWGGFTYETEVENGFYDVELMFAEIWGGAQEAGVRTFSLKVEDELVFQDLDLTDTAGFATAMDFVGTVEVTDGSLTIEGINDGNQNAKISAFSIWESDQTVASEFDVGTLFGTTTDDTMLF